MTRKCTVCNHKRRNEIEKRLVQGDAYRDIARQWKVTKDALLRHKENGHISAKLLKAMKAKEAGG